MVAEALGRRSGLRRYRTVARELAKNLPLLEAGGWKKLEFELRRLVERPDAALERVVSRMVAKMLTGLGPKQSRNLLQMLGATRYEIPLDSRLMKWFNEFGFPLHLTAKGLGDANYFELINDGVIALCEAADVYPCILDASIFASFDQGSWSAENLVW